MSLESIEVVAAVAVLAFGVLGDCATLGPQATSNRANRLVHFGADIDRIFGANASKRKRVLRPTVL